MFREYELHNLSGQKPSGSDRCAGFLASIQESFEK